MHTMKLESNGSVVREYSIANLTNGSLITIPGLTQCQTYTVTVVDGDLSAIVEAQTGMHFLLNLSRDVNRAINNPLTITAENQISGQTIPK